MNEKGKEKLRESLLSYFSTDSRFDVFHTETLSDNICKVIKETLEEFRPEEDEMDPRDRLNWK